MAIHFAHVSHRFRSVVALEQVDLHVRRGDCYGFIGHNGAGKTTALRIALGLVKPRSGRVTLDGRPAGDPRVRARVGGLIERPGFHDQRSGAANLDLLAGLQGIPRSERPGEIARVLERVGLGEVGAKRVGHYSQGMRQRLGLAAALLGSPRYLLLDEPTNGLDPQGIHDLRILLQQLTAANDLTILLSSHLLAEVADLCTRIGALHRGKVLVEAPTATLLAPDQAEFVLDTDDDAAAAALLADEGQPSTAIPGGGLRLRLVSGTAAGVVRRLVEGGREVQALAPQPPSLESIYLAYTTGERGTEPTEAPQDPAPDPRASDDDRIGTTTAIARVARYESRRLSRPGIVFALAIPCLLAPLVVYQRFLGLEVDAAEVEGGSLQSATGVTAFEALGRALTGTLPLLALILAGIASQSLAGELRGGTLRNILIRPFHRIEVILGKGLVLLGLSTLAYVALAATAALAAGMAFEYGDLVELLATGARYEHLKAEEVWPELWPVLASPLLPLAGFTALGFLCGSMARSSAGALAWTLGSITALELGRALARSWQVESWLLGPYLPSPLTRSSPLDYFVDVAGGVSRESWQFTATTPALWLLGCALVAVWVFHRRYVP